MFDFLKKLFGSKNKAPEAETTAVPADDEVDPIIALDDKLSTLSQLGDRIDLLNEQQKVLYLILNWEREMNNGGFSQFFYNSAGNHAHATPAALKTVGAHRMADILQRAIEQFPDSKVPTDWGQRQELVLEMEDTAEPEWEKLDKEFYAYPDDLYKLNMAYWAANKDKI
jgi:hypothetical protein